MAVAEYVIGADVFGTDRKIGKLIKVALDPHTRRVTDLIVGKGLVLKEDRVLPVSLVEKASEDAIHLSISAADVPSYPKYDEDVFILSDPDLLEELGYEPQQALEWTWRYGALAAYHGAPVMSAYRPAVRQRVRKGIDPDRPLIGRGTRVRNKREIIGYVDHLLLDSESGEILYLVLRRGLLPFRAIIPMTEVKEIGDDTVYIDLNQKELEALEQFTPRAEIDIRAEIEDGLRAVKEFDLSKVTVSLLDGIARLAGSVRDVRSKRRAHDLVSGVEGVIEVENEIMTDDEIEARVVSALLADPRTDLAIIDVEVESGIVTLRGMVESEEERDAALTIARAQKGVAAVLDLIEVGNLERVR